MRIDFPTHLINEVTEACRRSGINEVGGILFGEHIDTEHFRVAELTVDEQGLVANFKRSIQHVMGTCKRFFNKTNHDYRRFNYLGEWHSHPSYNVYPSSRDDQSMLEIVCDETVGANFVVLVIVRLNKENLEIKGWVYFPDNSRSDVDIKIVD
jgi:integrative and conjugative element protein (TIGR02256 family)